MLSKIPFDLSRLSDDEIEMEILRTGIIAELDAINLYEQLASLSKNEKIRKVFLNIAREEKTHVGEFQTLLLSIDREQAEEIEEGRREVEELN